MNKLFLVALLAICLVSVQAFVKRDAPADAASPNYVENIQKGLQDFGATFKEQVDKVLDPKVLKEKFGEFTDNINKALENLNSKPKQA